MNISWMLDWSPNKQRNMHYEIYELSRPNKRNNSVAQFEYLLNLGFIPQ